MYIKSGSLYSDFNFNVTKYVTGSRNCSPKFLLNFKPVLLPNAKDKSGCFKGIVHPKKKIVNNYTPSCHSKPVRHLFVFGTQIKIFLIKSERSLTIHRQQGSYHVQGPERYQEH